jgi:hypothetical protein
MITEGYDMDGNFIERVDDGQPVEIYVAPEVVAAQAISDEISSRIGSAETVAELRLAITDGLEAAIIALGGGQV